MSVDNAKPSDVSMALASAPDPALGVEYVISTWGQQAKRHVVKLDAEDTPQSQEVAARMPRAIHTKCHSTEAERRPPDHKASRHGSDEVITFPSVGAVPSKIEGLQEALKSATDTLVSENARAQAQMLETLHRFETVHLENHAVHRRLVEDMKVAVDALHTKFGDRWASEVEKDAKLLQGGNMEGEMVIQTTPPSQVGTRPKVPNSSSERIREYVGILRSRSTHGFDHVIRSEHVWDAKLKNHHCAGYTLPDTNPLEIAKETFANRYTCFERPKTRLAEIVDGDWFNIACSVIIVLNTFILGIQTNIQVQRVTQQQDVIEPSWFRPFSIVLMALFTIELLIRLIAERLYFFFGLHWAWNIFDMCMVCSAILEEMMHKIGGNLTFFRVLKIIKMGRAVRILRVIRYSRELRLMLSSIFASFVSLMWAFMLLVIIIYCSSVLICQGIVEYIVSPIGPDLIDAEHPLVEFYGSVTKAMHTHIMAISGGKDWYDLVVPVRPVGTFYSGLFMFYVLFVVFGMLNVLTGVFVDRATELGHLDRDLIIDGEKQKVTVFCKALQEIFKEVDDTGKGVIAWSQFNDYCRRDDVVAYLSSMQLNVQETKDLFHLLDTERTGLVNIEDFVFGCMRLKGAARSSDLLHIEEDVHNIKTLLLLIGEQITAITDALEAGDPLE